MGGSALEVVFHIEIGVAGVIEDLVEEIRMPIDDGIKSLEKTRAGHERLPGTDLLGRRSQNLDGSRKFMLFHEIGQGGRGSHGAHAQKVMAASMAGGAGDSRLLSGKHFLREPGKSIVFAIDADNGPAAPPGSHKSRGNPGRFLHHR